mmetsp:Transcript_23439/g.69635  ORF Transcript_23439/g.69635 Transcript_23439/m.69635 type:complete len:207 (-) Transcript_23439:348-968(-)
MASTGTCLWWCTSDRRTLKTRHCRCRRGKGLRGHPPLSFHRQHRQRQQHRNRKRARSQRMSYWAPTLLTLPLLRVIKRAPRRCHRPLGARCRCRRRQSRAPYARLTRHCRATGTGNGWATTTAPTGPCSMAARTRTANARPRGATSSPMQSTTWVIIPRASTRTACHQRATRRVTCFPFQRRACTMKCTGKATGPHHRHCRRAGAT